MRGKLEGIFSLVSIIREIMYEGGDNKVMQKLVEQVYLELDSLLEHMGSSVKRSEPPKVEKKEEQPATKFDLLSDLVGGQNE